MELKDLINRKILIATKHHKEAVVGPILKEAFNIDSIVLPNFDTDSLGTFTGEIERKSGPIECVRQKAKLALENSDCDLVLASEGSFGPHPSIFFAPCNEEFLYLFDKKNNFELSVKLLSTNTNFSQEEISSEADFHQFLERVKFPSHAIILKDSSNGHFFKGITELEEANELFHRLIEKNKKVHCETDMRAMYNPSRMENIKELTKKLVDTLQLTCPSCNTPGFQITDAKAGLPCELCNFPTASTLKYISKCLACNYEQEEFFPHKKQTEDPMYCNFCNP